MLGRWYGRSAAALLTLHPSAHALPMRLLLSSVRVASASIRWQSTTAGGTESPSVTAETKGVGGASLSELAIAALKPALSGKQQSRPLRTKSRPLARRPRLTAEAAVPTVATESPARAVPLDPPRDRSHKDELSGQRLRRAVRSVLNRGSPDHLLNEFDWFKRQLQSAATAASATATTAATGTGAADAAPSEPQFAVRLNASHYNAVMEGVNRLHDWRCASKVFALFEELKADGLAPSAQTFHELYAACRTIDDPTAALHLYSEQSAARLELLSVPLHTAPCPPSLSPSPSLSVSTDVLVGGVTRVRCAALRPSDCCWSG
jgi:hypothetical protein